MNWGGLRAEGVVAKTARFSGPTTALGGSFEARKGTAQRHIRCLCYTTISQISIVDEIQHLGLPPFPRRPKAEQTTLDKPSIRPDGPRSVTVEPDLAKRYIVAEHHHVFLSHGTCLLSRVETTPRAALSPDVARRLRY
jgi:hypothetical protein